MSIVLDGSDSFVRSANLPTISGFTIGGWFYLNSLASENGIFHFCNASMVNVICSLRYSSGNSGLRMFSDGGSVTHTSNPSTGAWYYIFLRCNGTTMESGWCDINHSSFPAGQKQSATQGTAITPGYVMVGGNGTYATSIDASVFRLDMWDAAVTDDNILLAAATDKGYTTGLNSHIPGTATGASRLDDTSGNGRNWSVYAGTLGDGSNPSLGSSFQTAWARNSNQSIL